VLGGAAAFEPRIVGLPVAAALVLTCWRYPSQTLQYAAFAVLVVRPWLDMFSVRRVGLGAWALNPAVIFGIGTLLAGSVLGAARLWRGQRIWPDGLLRRAHAWLFAAYGIGVMAGTFWYGGDGFANGIRELVRVSSIVAAFLMVLWWREESEQRENRGWTYLVLGLAPVIVVALWQAVYGKGEPELGLRRIQGTLSDPNSFGVYLVPFTVYAVAIGAVSRQWRRLVLLGAAVGLAVLITLTYSRTAMLILAISLIALPVLQLRRLTGPAIARGLTIIAILAAVAWAIAGSIVSARFTDLSLGRAAWEHAETGASENSFEWRLINWSVLVSMGREHLWTGHGAGMTTVLNPLISIANNLPFNAHDDFVRFFFETGLLGLTCYLLYAVWLCRWALDRARNADPAQAPARFAVVAALTAIFLLSLGTTEVSLNTVILYELYGMLALLMTTLTTPAPAPSRPG
jgi:O-antigen ligase